MPMTQRPFADVVGNGAPVVLLHGFGGFHGVWRDCVHSLGNHCRTIAYDLPGHAGSLGMRDRMTPRRSAAALLEDMTLRSPGQFHLVGHSMGGAIATLMALSAPQRIASLTLLAPGGFGETINERLLSQFARAQESTDLAICSQAMCGAGYQVSSADFSALEKVRKMQGQTETLIDLCAVIARDGRQGMIPRTALQALGMPVTVVWGDDDAVLAPHHADDLPSHFDLLRLPGAGHMLPDERPELVTELLRTRAT